MKIAIGTLARDSEEDIDFYQDFIDDIREVYKVDTFVVENDSKDGTKELLSEIADNFISEDLGLPKFEGSPASFERATLMCQYRNKLKDLIFSKDDYDIVIFSDIDLLQWPDISLIKQNIERVSKDSSIGAITSNGLSWFLDSYIYYDIWSLVINGKIQNHKIWSEFDIVNTEVDSAFGGLAIYNGQAIKDIEYKPINLYGYYCPWHPLERPACEHCGFNLELRKKGYRILIDKAQILYR